MGFVRFYVLVRNTKPRKGTETTSRPVARNFFPQRVRNTKPRKGTETRVSHRKRMVDARVTFEILSPVRGRKHRLTRPRSTLRAEDVRNTKPRKGTETNQSMPPSNWRSVGFEILSPVRGRKRGRQPHALRPLPPRSKY